MKRLVTASFVVFSSLFVFNCTTTEETPTTSDNESAMTAPTTEDATTTTAANEKAADQTADKIMTKPGTGMGPKGMRGSHAQMKDPALHEKLAKAHLDAANCLKSGKSAEECRMVMPPEAGKGPGAKMKDHNHDHFTQEMHASMAGVHSKVATCLREGKPADECTQMLDACPMADEKGACPYDKMGKKMRPGKKGMGKTKGKMR